MHRSFTFWSGLLLIAFTAWAWWDSASAISVAKLGPFYLTHASGGVAVGYSDTYPDIHHVTREKIACTVVTDPESGSIGFNHRPPEDPYAVVTAKPLFYSAPGQCSVFLPHWLLMIVFLALWSAMLLWRARRRKRRMTNLELPDEG